MSGSSASNHRPSIPSLRSRSAKPRKFQWSWTRSFVLPVVLLIGWEFLSQIGFFLPNLLPAPSVVIAAIWDLALSGELFRHIGITLFRVVLGFTIGAILATIFGALTGYSRSIHQFIVPVR